MNLLKKEECRLEQIKKTEIVLKWLMEQYTHVYQNQNASVIACKKCAKKYSGLEWWNKEQKCDRTFCECDWASKFLIEHMSLEYFQKDLERESK